MCFFGHSDSNSSSVAGSSQKWLIVMLFFWLVLTVARQAFDLIGKLWLPVAFNLLQLLACISGLFAAFQCRFGLLVSLSISTVLSILYNTTLLLWYGNFLGDRQSSLLSAGLPFGYSFFLRHTPFCGSHFNLTSSQWQQSANCLLPYYNLESFQALVHILVAILTLLFCILTLFGRREIKEKKYSAYVRERGKAESGSGQSNSSSQHRQTQNQKTLGGQAGVMMTNSTKVAPINGAQLIAPDSINDLSSGYMNSSYESPIEAPALMKRPKANSFAPASAQPRRSHKQDNLGRQSRLQAHSVAISQQQTSAKVRSHLWF